jgi:hypothetical protein
MIEIELKWPKEQKIKRKVRETKPLDGDIEEERSTRNMDHGQLNKQKNPPMNALEHPAGKKEGQVGEALNGDTLKT